MHALLEPASPLLRLDDADHTFSTEKVVPADCRLDLLEWLNSWRKRALLIAFHFPPAMGSSGPANFAFRHFLPNTWPGIAALPLPTSPGSAASGGCNADERGGAASPSTRDGTLQSPDAIRGFSAGRIAPERRAARMQLIRRFRPDLLWVTFPIATAARIGVELARRSGLPLVCDLRDPMTEDRFPEDPRVRSLYRALEERVVAQASRIVFTAPGALETYLAHAIQPSHRTIGIINNGYDERDFSTAAAAARAIGSPAGLELLHSGIIYPLERDPRPLFAAIAALKRDATADVRCA